MNVFCKLDDVVQAHKIVFEDEKKELKDLNCTDISLYIEEIPYFLFFSCSYSEYVLKIDKRAALRTTAADEKIPAKITYNRYTNNLSIENNWFDGDSKDLPEKLFRLTAAMADFLNIDDLKKNYRAYVGDRKREMMIITLEDYHLDVDIVFGFDRPEMMCFPAFIFGEMEMGRPYADEYFSDDDLKHFEKRDW